jgi:DNA-binding transcriptional MocR family regulator
MGELLFPVEHDGEVGLQTPLRRHQVDAILDGRLASDSPPPSCRRLAHALGVSRNTAVLTDQALADEGFPVSRQALGVQAIHRWTVDSVDGDDPLLIEEVRGPGCCRGAPQEIRITMGAQNALFFRLPKWSPVPRPRLLWAARSRGY